MKGKILITLIALGAASAALADKHAYIPAHAATISAAEPNYFDGLSLGLGAGIQHQAGEFKNANNESDNQSGTYFPSNLDSDIGQNSFNGELFAAYGKTFNSLYFAGIELYGRYAKSTTNVNHSTGYDRSTGNPNSSFQNTSILKADIQSDWSFGGALKFGYLITPKTMVYILTGLEHTKFAVDAYPAYNSVGSSNYSYKYSFSDNKLAFVPGIGIETMLTNKLSLSAQYTYAYYGKISHNATNSTTINWGGNVYDITSSPNDNLDNLSRGIFTMRLAYHFNGVPATAAAIPAAEPNYFDGLSLGLGSGLQHQYGEFKNASNDGGPSKNGYQSFPSNLDSDIGQNSFNGELFAAYGKTFNSLYFAGVELYGRYAKSTTNINHSTICGWSNGGGSVSTTNEQYTSTLKTNIKSDWSFGGALKFGYLITPKTMVYVLTGLEHTKFDASVYRAFDYNYVDYIIKSNSNSDSYNYKYSFSDSKWAFVPGIGLETMLTNKLSLSAQYTYAYYGKVSHSATHPATIREDGTVYNMTSSSNDNLDNLSRGVVTMRLAYHFNGI